VAREQKAAPTATVTEGQPTHEVSQQQTSPANGHLSQALTFVPEGTTQVSFVDWAWIKQWKGATALNSTHSIDERMKFLLDLSNDQPLIPQGVWSLYLFEKFSNRWSWDATDLIWEATITRGDEQPLHVIKFREDFDFAPVMAHFLDGSFEESQYDNVTVYSRRIEGPVSQYADAAVFNTAVIPGQNIFVLSAEVQNVHAALDASGKEGNESPISKQVGPMPERVGAQMAALVQIGEGACPFPGPTLRNKIPTANDILAQKASQVHAYSALEVAYHMEGKRAYGVIVFHYPDAVLAQKDLQVRSDEAARGSLVFLARGTSISEFLTLDNATVEGNDIVMRVQPKSGHFLTSMVTEHDKTFAVFP
jgi:hypothetical protein